MKRRLSGHIALTYKIAWLGLAGCANWVAVAYSTNHIWFFCVFFKETLLCMYAYTASIILLEER